MKAVTFSFDDGITQDQRLIQLLNRYGLKATFNINSELLGQPGSLWRENVTVAHVKPRPQEIRDIYAGHEIAAHTCTHPFLPALTEDEIVHQVEDDRLALSELAGYEVVGMAYPCGGANNDDRVADIIARKTGIRYARTLTSTHSFDLQDRLLRFNPTVYFYAEWDELFRLGQELIENDAQTPQLFYIWGHAYEFDIHNTWDRFEQFCRLIAGRPEIFYGTNREVLLDMPAPKA